MIENSEIHPFRSDDGAHLFVVNGSRIYDIEESDCEELIEGRQVEIGGLLDDPPYIDDKPLSPPPLRSLSLNVAQGCNMSCTYCYADEGRFGNNSRLMQQDVAEKSIDTLLEGLAPGEDAVIGFMGGEPFLNRKLIHSTTEYAAQRAQTLGVRARFSITTNATLLTQEDVDLLTSYPFTVAVSLDGEKETNDILRPMRNGSSSYHKAIKGLEKLTKDKRPKHLSVRATVTPRSNDLMIMLDSLLGLGVDEVGFSPVLVSPNILDQFSHKDFEWFLESMIECGTRCLDNLLRRRQYQFSNFETAMQEIHRGSHRPYPCGAAAGYASVSAEGNLFSCHRSIDDPKFAIGNLQAGKDDDARARFLSERHVLKQEPCTSCWARFLCGGGCHHEVISRGRLSCDYIRGWLDFCLKSYVELSSQQPGYFKNPETYYKQDGGHDE